MKLVSHFLILLYAFEKLVSVLGGTGSDTLLSGQSLSVNQTLVSQNGIFKFGFVNSDVEINGESNAYYYIGIWLVMPSEYPWNDKMVWTNQEYDLIDPVLSLSKNGGLVAIDRSDNSEFTIWSSNQTGGEKISPNLVLLDTGNLVLQDPKNSSRKFWSSNQTACDIDSFCGPDSMCQSAYDSLSRSSIHWEKGFYIYGCTRNISLSCEITNDSYVDSFYSIDNINRFPDNPRSLAVKTEDECEASCLSDCLCTAYSFTYNKCRLWFGELFNTNIRSDGWGGYVMNIRIRIVVYRSKSRISQRGVRIIVMFSTGLLIISALGLIIFFLYKRMIFPNSSKVDNLVLYSYAQMKSITKKFSEKLGEGGFGCVFKGKLPNSRLVAVKKLKSVHYEEKQFRSEIQTIGIIQHVNLVRLLGFCAEGTKRLLIYEYMPNGSLNSHIFPKNSEILSWNTRYKIVLGIARGLAYLHEECRDCIVHCDIKPENILLDEFFCPKIADFGMAKLFGRDFSRVLTTMRGTIGYLAPEWISGEPITQKIDVYSFGMILFEIISGRRNAEKIKKRECTYFPLYAAIKINQGDVLCLLDERLEGNDNLEEIDKACKVACWCIQDFEDHRPTMRQVVHMLEGNLEMELPPIPKSLRNLVDIENDSIYSVGE